VNSKTFKRFIGYARPYWALVAGATFFGILKFTMALSLPASLGWVTEYVMAPDMAVGDKLIHLFTLLGLLTLALLLRTPVTYLRSYLAAKACNRTVFDIRMDLFRHVQRLSLAYHSRRRSGNITARLIADLNDAQGLLNEGVVAVLMDVIFLIGVTVLLLVMDWRLACVSLSTLPLYGLVFYYLNPKLRKAATDVQSEMEEMSGDVTEKLSGLQVVQSFVREDAEATTFFERQMQYLNKVLRRVRVRTTLTTIAEFLQAFGPVVVICYGGYKAIQNPAFLPHLIMFYGFIQHLYLPTRRLADCSAMIQEKLAALDRVFEILDSEPDIRDAAGAKPFALASGHIQFQNVQFGYSPEKLILDDISFDVEPGRAVAIVGRSGAGKTTLVNLVPRFYDVHSGAVMIDGQDVRNITVRSLRSTIGMVLQDSILFTGTIRENILYGRHDATEDDMLRAARMAHVDEFVETMPLGYNTPIGERGVTLSGGQKQRISIARAFLYDPRILILDEATSNLDSRAEAIIQDALRELMQGRTTLVIAHRLSTIIDCDAVLVIDQGRMVEYGPHRKLLQNGGLYCRLCDEQFGRLHTTNEQRL